jgi:hypothetical protein
VEINLAVQTLCSFLFFHQDQNIWKELWHATKQDHRYQKGRNNFYRHLFWLMKAHLMLLPLFKKSLIPKSKTLIVKPWSYYTMEDLALLKMIGLDAHGLLHNQQNWV